MVDLSKSVPIEPKVSEEYLLAKVPASQDYLLLKAKVQQGLKDCALLGIFPSNKSSRHSRSNWLDSSKPVPKPRTELVAVRGRISSGNKNLPQQKIQCRREHLTIRELT